VTRSILDRRTPYRGDQRRAKLLSALDELLRETSFDAINIADISERAGVTRSAFYFYFENKAAAVAALAEDMYQIVAGASAELYDTTKAPRRRIEHQVRSLIAAWEKYRYLYAAMLEARQTNPSVRELWDSSRESFIAPVAAMIDAERAAGNAPAGPASSTLAKVLVELNDLTVERIALGDALPIDDRIDALVTIWLRTIYGTETT
jgi:TetR/AcrR family transcriptional regulator, ethionamide resistance regulator